SSLSSLPPLSLPSLSSSSLSLSPPLYLSLSLSLPSQYFSPSLLNLLAFRKAVPVFFDVFDVSHFESIKKDLNFMIAGGLQSGDTSTPAKELFYGFQQSLKGLSDISVYAGDHILSLRFEGFEFDRIFLSKEELLALDLESGWTGLLAKLQSTY